MARSPKSNGRAILQTVGRRPQPRIGASRDFFRVAAPQCGGLPATRSHPQPCANGRRQQPTLASAPRARSAYPPCDMDVLQLDVSGPPASVDFSRAKRPCSMPVTPSPGPLGRRLPRDARRRATRHDGRMQSRIDVHPIIAVRGAIPSRAWRHVARRCPTPSCSPATARPVRLLRPPLPLRRPDAANTSCRCRAAAATAG